MLVNRRRLLVLAFVTIVICAVAALVAFHTEIAIGYHYRAMMRAEAKIREIGPNGNQTPWIDRFEYHRGKLVQCGYFVRREFPLAVKPPETRRVWKHLVAEFPDHVPLCGEMQSTEWGRPENKIIIWDRPDRIPVWEAAIRKYDVPELPATEPASVPG